MARETLFRHRKFIKLARLLKSKALAVGHLELMWQACYESGDPNVGTADDLEAVAEWDGKPGVLTSHLLDCGFIDEQDDGIFAVHDLEDHWPDNVRKRYEREQERRQRGETLREIRAKAGQKGGRKKKTADCDNSNELEANGKQTEANAKHVLTDSGDGGKQMLTDSEANERTHPHSHSHPHSHPHAQPAPPPFGSVDEELSHWARQAAAKQGRPDNRQAVGEWLALFSDLVKRLKIPIVEVSTEVNRPDRMVSEKEWEFRDRMLENHGLSGGKHGKRAGENRIRGPSPGEFVPGKAYPSAAKEGAG